MEAETVILRERGPRLYVLTCGFELREALGRFGAHFDRERRQWWTGTAKREALETVIASEGYGFRYVPEGIPFRGTQTRVIGSARHAGQLHYVIWAGERQGREMVKLVTLDATAEFWTDAAEVDPVKEYRSPKTVGELMAYAAMMQNAQAGTCPRCKDAPSESCPICQGKASPKVPLFLSINNFAKRMNEKNDAKASGLRDIGREWPTVQEVKGIAATGELVLIKVPHVNFDIRHISKNGKHGVRAFFTLTGGRVYLAREHENYSRDRFFFVHATPDGEATEVTESWVRTSLSTI